MGVVDSAVGYFLNNVLDLLLGAVFGGGVTYLVQRRLVRDRILTERKIERESEVDEWFNECLSEIRELNELWEMKYQKHTMHIERDFADLEEETERLISGLREKRADPPDEASDELLKSIHELAVLWEDAKDVIPPEMDDVVRGNVDFEFSAFRNQLSLTKDIIQHESP